jgi:hypothetical protein
VSSFTFRARFPHPEIGRRAGALGRQIRGEDGVARAVEVLERHLRLRKDAAHPASGPGPHLRSRLATRPGRGTV